MVRAFASSDINYASLQKQVLAKNFPCLFCNHEKSVSVKLDKKAGIGELSCKVCGQQFQTGINCECKILGFETCWTIGHLDETRC